MEGEWRENGGRMEGEWRENGGKWLKVANSNQINFKKLHMKDYL